MANLKDVLGERPDRQENWTDWMVLIIGALVLASLAAAMIS